MFTGLIEAICVVKSVRRSGGSMQLTIDLGKLSDGCKIGDSIAVKGVCLTIIGLNGNLAIFDISSETLTKSNLGELSPSSQVNVEHAIRADSRLGGHFVQGHIDGTATIKSIEKQDQFANIKFAADKELLNNMVAKGSVAVDGISLTVVNISENSFSVTLIPETLKKTTLSTAKIGNAVNIETDIIVKTVKKLLEKILPQKERLTVEKLKQLGF